MTLSLWAAEHLIRIPKLLITIVQQMFFIFCPLNNFKGSSCHKKRQKVIKKASGVIFYEIPLEEKILIFISLFIYLFSTSEYIVLHTKRMIYSWDAVI